MKEYKRLTHRNGKNIEEYCKVGHCHYADECTCKYEEGDTIYNVEEDCKNAMIDRLAELEDKIERGELVENTVITYVNMARTNCKTLIDKALKYDQLKAKIENGTLIELPCMMQNRYGDWRVHFYSDRYKDIDCYTFDSKEEAEQKLLELQGDK